MMINNFYKLMSTNNFYTTSSRLKFYLENQLFPDIDFNGKSIIDIGGGNGLFGFYAALNGAKEVLVMEPEFDGSQNNMISQFNQIKNLLDNPDNIFHTNKVLEDYERNKTFDYVLMHNSINHIDEEACIVLQTDERAKEKYFAFFSLLQEICHSKTRLIICDCDKSNFWNSISLKNPIAPSIEWEKHQSPNYWSKLLTEKNFKHIKTSWNSPNVLGKIGHLITANKFISYFLQSHFRLEMQYQGKIK